MAAVCIVLNGPSCSGKSSIAAALQDRWPRPLQSTGIDTFLASQSERFFAIDGTLRAVVDGTEVWTRTIENDWSGGWRYASVRLSDALADRSVPFTVRLEVETSATNLLGGWSIDDLAITGVEIPPPPPPPPPPPEEDPPEDPPPDKPPPTDQMPVDPNDPSDPSGDPNADPSALSPLRINSNDCGITEKASSSSPPPTPSSSRSTSPR